MVTQPLITRLSELDAPDREVDAEIMSLFYVRGKRHIGAYMENDFGIDEPVDSDVWIDPKTDRWVSTSALFFTASVDATIALAERVLPGKGIDLLREAISELGKKYHWHICLKKPEQVKELPIQVCIALLRAKEASK